MKTKTKKPYRPKPGSDWRIQAAGAKHGDALNVSVAAGALKVQSYGIFDELVIDQWLHLEQMGPRSWWMRVGDARLSIRIDKDGQARVTVERGVYGEER